MVKFKIGDFNSCCRNKFSEFDGILFYGPDRGQVLENFNIALESVVPEVDDGFSVFEFASGDIKSDPSKLIDEATAISFLGTRKVIKIKDANDDIVETLETLLKSYEKLEAFIVVSAGELSPSSKLRTLFEYNKRLAALPNYIDDGENLSMLIKQSLAKSGIRKIPDDVLLFLCARLGENRATTRMELEKLSLYLYGKNEITLDDARKCIMDSSSINLQDLALVVAEGNYKKLSLVLPRLIAEGNSPVMLLRMVVNHFKNLYYMASEKENGVSVDEIIKNSKPKIFFKLEPSYKKQLDFWSSEKIIKIISQINEADIKCKSANAPVETIVSQLMFMICSVVNKRY